VRVACVCVSRARAAHDARADGSAVSRTAASAPIARSTQTTVAWMLAPAACSSVGTPTPDGKPKGGMTGITSSRGGRNSVARPKSERGGSSFAHFARSLK
jgi:hypothetical protein